MVNKKVTVAQYIEQMVALSDKSQKEIAEAMGYDKPNIITMFKQGSTKLPINKVAPFAKAVGADPVHLLRLVMQEYMPETWESLQGIIGQSLVTESELKAVKAIRKTLGGVDLDFGDKNIADAVTAALEPFVEAESHDRKSAAKAARGARAAA
jgi:predicted XRE-type DNA-binding protein